MTFLQRLVRRGVHPDKSLLSDTPESSSGKKVAQLPVDVCQSAQHVTIYAQAPGVDMDDITISVEGQANIIIIEGTQIRPDDKTSVQKSETEDIFFTQECTWGEFYRRIILPESIIIDKTEAKIKDGILIITLPLLKANPTTQLSDRAHPRDT